MTRKNIFEHKYADLYFDSETMIIEEIWKTTTEEMTDEEYKKYQTEKLDITRKVMPKLFLCDTKNFLYVMHLEMQEWTDEKLNKFWEEINLQKFAMIMSQGFIEQIALEQTMSEREEMLYPVRFFDNAKEAKNWLLEN